MERRLRSRKASEKESLPGERQGMPGVGAGHDSEQTANGRLLDQQAPVSQEAIAEYRSESSPQHLPATPEVDVLPVPQLATIATGQSKKRLQWSRIMNEDLMRCYFKVTCLETMRMGYRQKLYREFISIYPNMNTSEQHIAGQYRSILKNNLIPTARIDAIREEVKKVISTTTEEFMAQPESQATDDETNSEGAQQFVEAVEKENACRKEEERTEDNLETLMSTAITEFEDTNPIRRPKIPKVNTSKKLAKIIDLMNTKILPAYISNCRSIEQLHLIVYCGAVTIVRAVGIDFNCEQRPSRKNPNFIPKWERRLNNKIKYLRQDIAQLVEYVKGVRSRKLTKKVKKIMQRHGTHTQREGPNSSPCECLDTMKQKLSVFSSRLRRYKLSNKRKTDNCLFNKSEKTFYRTMRQTKSSINPRYPTLQSVQDFWERQLSDAKLYNSEASWLKGEQQKSEQLPQMENVSFTAIDVKDAVGKLMNWKSPGPDRIQNFWYKRLTCVHGKLSQLINDALDDPKKMPGFLTHGITYLLPKDAFNTHDPTKYRPITCLPTLYKIISSCLAHKMFRHCEQNNIIAPQQKGCSRGSKGCKEQLIIDSVVCGQAYKNHRNIYMAYIDYKKAFDSVRHTGYCRSSKYTM